MAFKLWRMPTWRDVSKHFWWVCFISTTRSRTLQCTCSISHFWPFVEVWALQGTLFRWRALCCLFFFQSCRCSVEIVSTLVPAKRIDTLAKNRFFLRSSYYYYVESVLSDVLFPSFRNTTAVQIELNNVPYTFSVPKNMTSSSSKSQNPPGVLDFFTNKKKKHNKKHIHHSKIKNSWAIDFHIHINHQVGPGVDLNDGSL